MSPLEVDVRIDEYAGLVAAAFRDIPAVVSDQEGVGSRSTGLEEEGCGGGVYQNDEQEELPKHLL